MRSNSITSLESFSHINTIASPARERARTYRYTRATTFHCHKLVFLHNYTLSDTSRHVKNKKIKRKKIIKKNNNNTSLFINNIPSPSPTIVLLRYTLGTSPPTAYPSEIQSLYAHIRI